MKDLRTTTELRLSLIQRKLERAYKKAALANESVERLEKHQRALQSALDIMDGKEVTITFPNGLPDFNGRKFSTDVTPSPAAKLPPNTVLLNGEPVVLEQGWTVGKTEQGEEVLVPPVLPRSDQSRPVAPPVILPPIGSDDGFASDLPGGM